MKKVKIITKVLMHALLWLSINFAQASDLIVENSNSKLSKKNIEQAVDNIIILLKNKYVFPNKTLLIEEELKHQLARNELNKISDWYLFIRRVNSIMRNVSGDMYLDIIETKPFFKADFIFSL